MRSSFGVTRRSPPGLRPSIRFRVKRKRRWPLARGIIMKPVSVRVDRRTAIEILGTSLTVAAMRPLQARAQTLTTVRVGAGLDDGLTPLLYALHVGMFKKAGLDVQLQSSSNGAVLAAAVAG